ncbi:transcriptional regulator with XRE-family HTH domain [Catenuloplanes nepalensis]|uniref:Transcriptional regulator with XRE-family HTH domain n=1 Tax=Catenuloplanes nepalensis TaxID=587533 RepID=A0ABT9N0U1_9ACTN|nr:helix-turn-helix transcriptional regulator [Catenuloplanes nepalensis]MDP9797056.1 transcriptional regulator with XRE-family HTH domain [Catenuloplanes nepalensis]
MTAQDPPAVARRRVRLALRNARQRRKLTQQQVADALEWSLSKVQRIESGDVSISTTDLRAALALLGIADPRRIAQLIEDAKASRRQRWWTTAEYREHLSPAMLQLLQFESEATAIRVFQATLIPGVLQTRAYAGWIQHFWAGDIPHADMKVRVELRTRRGESLFEVPDPPKYLLILDESVLHREVGGAEVFAEQLEYLLEKIRQERVTVRFVPFSDAVKLVMLGSFTILELPDEEDVFLYQEEGWGDSMHHSLATIHRYREIFEQAWEASFPPDVSARLIESCVLRLRTLLDRQRHSA